MSGQETRSRGGLEHPIKPSDDVIPAGDNGKKMTYACCRDCRDENRSRCPGGTLLPVVCAVVSPNMWLPNSRENPLFPFLHSVSRDNSGSTAERLKAGRFQHISECSCYQPWRLLRPSEGHLGGKNSLKYVSDPSNAKKASLFASMTEDNADERQVKWLLIFNNTHKI